MDLNGLIWTKNVKPINGERWAYKSESIATPFALHWRNLENRDVKNALAPEEGELIILRQRSKVTHIVKMLNKPHYPDKNAGDEFNIYRLVQVVWITDNWDNPPHRKDVFGNINFPPNGKSIRLQNIPKFQERWNTAGLEFQQYVQQVLNIH